MLAGIVSGVVGGAGDRATADTPPTGTTTPTEMTYETDVFGVTRPVPASQSNEDADQWADILETEFVPDFEGMVAFHGPLADRPASPPFDVVYHATDYSEWYRYDASAGEWLNASPYIDEGRFRYNPGKTGARAAYQHLGEGSQRQLGHVQDTVGARQMVQHWPMVAHQFQASDFSYTFSGGASERVQLINYGFLDEPPNKVPVLRCVFNGKTETTGDIFEVGVRHKTQPANQWLTTFEAGPDDAGHQLYDEIFLNEVGNGSAARGPDTLTHTQLEVHAGIDDTTTSNGTIQGSASLMLDWEVI